ncbi:Uncharacterized protein APZ42_033398 [Daphnia magna]|uniref:Uncharacterized protein n=1 Tax=Daphnia magna TaxID=35525 RepID=A0A164L4R8_9CRUS|nr:Uncharacterized protein APZ42_033398 [Daphnia magna]
MRQDNTYLNYLKVAKAFALVEISSFTIMNNFFLILPVGEKGFTLHCTTLYSNVVGLWYISQ